MSDSSDSSVASEQSENVEKFLENGQIVQSAAFTPDSKKGRPVRDTVVRSVRICSRMFMVYFP